MIPQLAVDVFEQASQTELSEECDSKADLLRTKVKRERRDLGEVDMGSPPPTPLQRVDQVKRENEVVTPSPLAHPKQQNNATPENIRKPEAELTATVDFPTKLAVLRKDGKTFKTDEVFALNPKAGDGSPVAARLQVGESEIQARVVAVWAGLLFGKSSSSSSTASPVWKPLKKEALPYNGSSYRLGPDAGCVYVIQLAFRVTPFEVQSEIDGPIKRHNSPATD